LFVVQVIVGESGVGKSSLMRRFAKNEYMEQFIATIGVDVRFPGLSVCSPLAPHLPLAFGVL
jgi:hypothetical protein